MIGFAGIILFLSSCASMSMMQTARTTEKGKLGTSYGGGVVQSELILGTSDTLDLNAPFAEVGARYGITDNLDAGLKLTLIGTGVADVKYQFIGDSESVFAGSVGLGVGYLSIESGSSKSSIYDLMVPAYFSVHPTDWLGIYAGPRYVFRINSYNTDQESDTGTSHWYGGTAGIRLGGRVAFLGEFSYFGTSNQDTPLTQITGGLSIGIR